MSKIIEATCKDGIVTADSVPVPNTVILSKGVAQSSGLLIMEEGKKTYLASTISDLELLLEKLIAALGQTVTALNQTASALGTHDSAGFLISATMGIPSPPLVAGNVSAISAASGEIDTLKTALQTLKGNLK